MSVASASEVDYASLSWPCNFSSYAPLDEKRSKIGQGAFSSVYLTRCLIPIKGSNINSADCVREYDVQNHSIAVKVMDLENILSTFDDVVQEVRTMKLCVHENILRCYCSFVCEDKLWLAMQYMDKGSCVRVMDIANKQLRLGEGLNEEWCAYILREALKGLAYLHEKGHLHRDLKPGNILLSSRGEVRLADFGVTGWLMIHGTRQESAKTFVGTPCYMAPEVLEQVYGYDQKADIWSLGITALELAKGYAPYSRHSAMKILVMTLENDPPSLTSYPNSNQRNGAPFSKHFEDFYRKCLQKHPKSRCSADELLKHKFLRHRTEEALVNELLNAIPSVDYKNIDANSCASSNCNNSNTTSMNSVSNISSDGSRTGQQGGAVDTAVTKVINETKYVAGTTWVFDFDEKTSPSSPTNASTTTATSVTSSEGQGERLASSTSGRISSVSLMKGTSSSGSAVVRIQYKDGSRGSLQANESNKNTSTGGGGGGGGNSSGGGGKKYNSNNIETILDEFESEAASIKTKAPSPTFDYHGGGHAISHSNCNTNSNSSSSSSSSNSNSNNDNTSGYRSSKDSYRNSNTDIGPLSTQFLMDELEEIIKGDES